MTLALQKADAVMKALLGTRKVDVVRRRFASFEVAVCLEDPPEPNAVNACSVALNLLPRMFRRVRYAGPESAVKMFPPSHASLLGSGGGQDAHATLVFGRRMHSCPRTLYVGSSGWSSYLSWSDPCPWIPPTPNALGAMHAGALAVGEVFKMMVPEARPETAPYLEYDLVTHGRAKQPVTEPSIPNTLDLGDLMVVGCGAIGQALLCALCITARLTGKLTLVDHDRLDRSNEQRYMAAFAETRGMPKTEYASKFLYRQTLLKTNQVYKSYEDYAATANICTPDIAVCVDNKQTRVNAQAALPRMLWNGWTDVSNNCLRYGVNRHSLAGDSECLACSYRPRAGSPSREDLDASKTGLDKDRLREIRARNEPCSRALLREISSASRVRMQVLRRFVGRSFSDLLHGDCGLFYMNQGEDKAPTPAPHQSALAGILLASQLVLERIAPGASALKSLSDFDALRVPNPLCLLPSKRHPKCVCSDPVYRNAYEQKWGHGAVTCVSQTRQ